MIVEDDPNTAERFASIVEYQASLRLVGSASSVNEALSLIDTLRPNILLCDLGLPDGSGIDIIQYIRHQQYQIDVLVITLFDDEPHVIRSIEAGACGYLLKDGYDGDIAQSILDVVHGGSPISPSIARYLLRRFQPTTLLATPNSLDNSTNQTSTKMAPENLPHLTEKEKEVLNYLAKGFTYVEISQLLGMSSHTVSSHTKHIYKKLEVRSRAEAVFEAAQLGIVILEKHAQ
jgi:DNA-binding NarL/FixJ family response regulator